eukprot:5720544-Amphidinium_carterae.1
MNDSATLAASPTRGAYYVLKTRIQTLAICPWQCNPQDISGRCPAAKTFGSTCMFIAQCVLRNVSVTQGLVLTCNTRYHSTKDCVKLYLLPDANEESVEHFLGHTKSSNRQNEIRTFAFQQ